MKLIVGLGNPGDIYSDSRHNIGFSVIKALCAAQKAALKRDSGTFSLSAKFKVGGHSVIAAMPMTFMNLSGNAVKALLRKHKIDLKDLLIILDDLDLDLGRLRIRPDGSSGGHKGLASIIDSVASSGFARLRVGIGRPPRGIEPSEYVLMPFLKKEKKEVKDALEIAAECSQSWVREGLKETMNNFNTRSKCNE